ncbi:MAG: ribonuclease R [Cellvibrionaceae bacterium]|jgi:ribonuclease R
MSARQLEKALSIESDEAKEALRRRLIAMERDGQIHSNRKQAYARVDQFDLIRGRVQGHRDGFGFVIPADGSGDDVYLASRQMRKVFDGDEVLVRLSSTGIRGRRDGVIVDVVKHNTHQVVGRYFSEHGIGFVRPDNPRLGHNVLVAAEDAQGATHNQFVMVEITHQPSRNSQPMGLVAEVLGDHMAPGMEIDVSIRAHDIPHEWPEAVSKAAEKLPSEVEEEDKKYRVDCRHLPFVTIDGEDARDFDDAVYCEAKKTGGWRLYVAIADVSHYVQVGSALDREAEVRSTSVYFPDFVVPMLPEALSNGLCSLKPKVDRLAMVCEATISEAGKVSGYHFYEAIIYSHARLTYTQVGQMLDNKDELYSSVRQQYSSITPHIDHLHTLYQVLRKTREVRGAIDFETTETRILFDRDRKIEKIIPVVRNEAHKLIEECMLCANVCAARFLEAHEIEGLYRVHGGPKEQKLENLRTFLGALGLNLHSKGMPEPSHYQKLLESIGGRADAKIIQTVMLRSLSQAVYQPENKGHFGLAYPAYTHFTSPIRRYPDLLTHRAIRSVIHGKKESNYVRRVEGASSVAKKNIYPYDLADMLRLGEHTSMAERRADEATRDVVSWLKCEYLQDHVGDVFQGIITGVTNFGVFVELLDIYVEGLVHITSLPSDYYRYEDAHHRLVGERSNQVFSLGDELTVKVAAINLDERKVDFDLTGDFVRKGDNKVAGAKKSGSGKGGPKRNGAKKGSAKKIRSEKNRSKKSSLEKNSLEKNSLEKNSPQKSASEINSAKKRATKKDSSKASVKETIRDKLRRGVSAILGSKEATDNTKPVKSSKKNVASKKTPAKK